MSRIEQVLPTLATGERMEAAIQAAVTPLVTSVEFDAAIQAAVASLVTRVELDAAIQAAVAPLATRVEVEAAIQAAVAPLATRAEVREEGERTRRHFDMVAESMRDDIRIVAEGHVALHQRLEEVRRKAKERDASLDKRVTRLEAKR